MSFLLCYDLSEFAIEAPCNKAHLRCIDETAPITLAILPIVENSSIKARRSPQSLANAGHGLRSVPTRLQNIARFFPRISANPIPGNMGSLVNATQPDLRSVMNDAIGCTVLEP